MASSGGVGNSSPAPEPYNVWADEHVNEDELDMEELIRIEEAAGISGIDGSLPTRYSAQTIRQKKGRQLASTMRTSPFGPTSISSESPSTSPPSSVPSSHKEDKSDSVIIEESAKVAPREVATSSNVDSSSSVSAGGAFPSVGLYQGLGRLQAFSAIAFGAFGFIHMVPPILASVGGIELANKALIWGRVYYQTYGFEQVFVYGSLAVHIGTSLCKAIVRFVWKSKSYYASTRPVTDSQYADRPKSKGVTTITTSTTTTITSSKPGAETSSTSSTNISGGRSGNGTAPGLFPYHRLVGWVLAPLVLGHMDTMRMTPIKVLGDSSMLDYSYVTFLHRMNRPAPYLLLVCFMAYHMFGGAPVAVNMVLPKGSESRIKARDLIKSKKARAAVAGAVSTVVLVGVYRIMNAEDYRYNKIIFRTMAEYKGTSQEGARHQKLERQREKMMSEFEQQRAQIARDNEVKVSSDKFVVQHDNVEEALRKSTIGLVHLKDFRKAREELEELKRREAAKTNQIQEKVVKKKAKKTISKLSFADEEEEEEAQEDQSDDKSKKKRAGNGDNGNESEESSNNKSDPPVFKRAKFGKDPNIDTSFLPDREREEQERKAREELRQEWLRKQEEIKKEVIQITYSYWDGSGHRKEVECKKGDTIAQFLEKCRQQFQQLRGVSIDNLMYVKEDLIIPHHYTFYDFIINKARGKSGPLFSFDVHEDIRLTNDANVEKDESHAGKVVERTYYERNKHIFPLSRFEIYDPEKSYGKYTIKGK
ncbi:hypothetical protein BGX20_007003 [Mortierella sp. AD010]|nr:hypothetical protein BGX20_007003 [Mortierella sp. AD010]